MRKILILILLLTLTFSAVATERFSAQITFYNNGSAEIGQLNKIDTERPESSFYQAEEEFSIQLKSSKNVIREEDVPVSFSRAITRTKTVYSNKTGLNILIDYEKQVETLTVLHEGIVKDEKKFTKELCSNFDNTCSSYCSGKGVDVDCTCGDGVCQEDANERELCPKDCRESPEPQDGGGDENQSSTGSVDNSGESTEVVDSGYNTGLLIIIAVLAILIALVLGSGKIKVEA